VNRFIANNVINLVTHLKLQLSARFRSTKSPQLCIYFMYVVEFVKLFVNSQGAKKSIIHGCLCSSQGRFLPSDEAANIAHVNEP